MARKLGMTSNQFIDRMETKGTISDENVIGLPKDKVIKIAQSTDTISKTTKRFKDLGMTEFATGWTTQKLILLNEALKKASGLTEMLSGGISPEEVEKINRAISQRGKKKFEELAL